jgi:hypothetical protein
MRFRFKVFLMLLQACSTTTPVPQSLKASLASQPLSVATVADRFAHEHQHEQASPQTPQEPQGFFSKLMQSVTDFLKALFGNKAEASPEAKPHAYEHKQGAHDGHVCGPRCPVHGET